MIVALGHKARTGKDTIAAHLVERHGFTRMAFADPLKQAAKLLCSFTEDQINGATKEVPDKFWGFSPRWFLQRFGTEVCRGIRSDFWVRLMLRRMAELPARADVVVTDMRFPNEALAMEDAGAFLVLVNRPGVETVSTHSSENSMGATAWDWTIINDRAIEDLHKATDAMVADFRARRIAGRRSN